MDDTSPQTSVQSSNEVAIVSGTRRSLPRAAKMARISYNDNVPATPISLPITPRQSAGTIEASSPSSLNDFQGEQGLTTDNNMEVREPFLRYSFCSSC
jgi:hypothetical protein